MEHPTEPTPIPSKKRKSTNASATRRKLPHPTLQRDPYESYSLTDPNGTFLAFIPKKRFAWYQKKGLASLVSDDTIRLHFEPRKVSVDDFQREKLANRCVVCGTEEHLTRHHIVPYEYRQHLLVSYKSKNSHDIVAICTDCHASYENVAHLKKKALSEKYGIPLIGEGKWMSADKSKIKKLANALLRARDKMPEERRKEVEEELSSMVEGEIYTLTPHEEGEQDSAPKKTYNDDYLRELSTMQVTEVAETGYFTHGELMVRELLKDCISEVEKKDVIQEFVVSWRRHFLEHANPQHMSAHWDVERPIGDAER